MSVYRRLSGWLESRLLRSHEAPEGIAYDTISVQSREDDRVDWLFEVTACLRAGPRAANGQLILDVLHCPLFVEDVTSDRSSSVQRIVSRDGLPSILLALDSGHSSGWDGAHLRFTLLWSREEPVLHGAKTDGDGGMIAPCVVIPDMLPRLIAVDEALSPHRGPLPRISMFSGFQSLAAAGIEALGDATGAVLQGISFERPADPWVDDDVGAVLFDRTVDGTGARPAMLERIRLMKDFIGAELGFVPSIHTVVCVSTQTYPKLPAPTGAFCVVHPSWVAAKKPYTRKDSSVVQQLTLGWLGGGVRLSGENAHELTLALGFALGLRWLAVHDSEHFRATLCAQQAALARAKDMVSRTTTQRILALQLPLFAAMEHGGIGLRVGDLLRQSWGRYVDQDVFVAQLRQFGVTVPGVFS